MERSHGGDRHGARQPERFDPARAARLDDPARFAHVAPDAILALLAPPPGATLIDFGTGTGLYAFALAALRPDLHVVALDEQAPMLAYVREKAARHPGAAVVAATTAEPAERLLALNVLHEVGDDALRAMLGLLRPGGRALVIDWRRDPARNVGPPDDHVYAPDEARARLERAGARVRPAGTFPYHFGFLVDA